MVNVDISLSLLHVYFICIDECHTDPALTVGLHIELVTIGLSGVSTGSAYTCVCVVLCCVATCNSAWITCDFDSLKADSHITCRAHAVPLPCRAAKGLECVFPI